MLSIGLQTGIYLAAKLLEDRFMCLTLSLSFFLDLAWTYARTCCTLQDMVQYGGYSTVLTLVVHVDTCFHMHHFVDLA